MAGKLHRSLLAAIVAALFLSPICQSELFAQGNFGNRGVPENQNAGRYPANSSAVRGAENPPRNRADQVPRGQISNAQRRQGQVAPGQQRAEGRHPGPARVVTPHQPRVPLRGGQRPAVPAANRFAVYKPEWADQLLPRHKEHLLQILRYWEHTSKKVETYRCSFQRWEYDSVFGPRDDCKTYSKGELKYASPDKGLFRIDKVLTYQPSQKPGEPAKHVELPDVKGEYWICDGKSIFEHDYHNKKLIQREIPEQLRGTAITRGPLPFMFGARADDILARYWIRVITPPSVVKKKKKQFWLEAYPKRPEDAANYLKTHIIIDYDSYLPEGLVMFDRGYRPPYNDSRTVFRFDQRKVNFNKNIMAVFMREFYEVKTPRGWQKIEQPVSLPPAKGQNRSARIPPAQPRR